MAASDLVTPASSQSVADFTSPGLIIPYLRGQEATAVIKELSTALQRESRIADLLPFYHAAINREFLCSTEMEEGLAFPHARVNGLTRTSFALGRSEEPLVWGPKRVPSVRLVFLLAVPETDATEYLTLISGLARLGRDRCLVEKLLCASDTLGILFALTQVRLRLAGRATLPSQRGDSQQP